MKNNKIISFILILILIIGICLLLYPTISNYWNSFHQSKAIQQYETAVEQLDEETCNRMLEEAEEYNRNKKAQSHFELTESEKKLYNSLLNISGDGVMGYLEIPVIGVKLPICHSSSEIVLQSSIGHLEWTSLPVGGDSTHSVLTGHRGLPSSRLLTDLDRIALGDRFKIKVLNRVLTYEVDLIRIVEPSDIKDLKIVENEDYCTLMTCTPYGINTHRLLVRGTRVFDVSDIDISADAMPVEPMMVAPIVFIMLVLIILLLYGVIHSIKKRILLK